MTERMKNGESGPEASDSAFLSCVEMLHSQQNKVESDQASQTGSLSHPCADSLAFQYLSDSGGPRTGCLVCKYSSAATPQADDGLGQLLPQP
jgi:hypothetical protein